MQSKPRAEKERSGHVVYIHLSPQSNVLAWGRGDSDSGAKRGDEAGRGGGGGAVIDNSPGLCDETL